MFAFVRMAWEELFSSLITFGKILTFPFLAIFSILISPFAFIEFFTIDIMVFLFLLLSKNDSPKDFIDFVKDYGGD